MDLLWIALAAFSLIVIFIITQVIAILFLLKENARLGELAEKNSPPF
jgi:hypothetical protein